jgi:cold shock CspA family protein
MARANSFNKKEIEKNKQQKRKEKLQRKEERKQQSPSSFEDMIAYVDANGVITDVPPEITKKEVIELEDIEISIPRQEFKEEKGDPTGRVDFFDETRGFGFIKEKNSVNKFFFHKSNAEEGISEDNMVTFKLERGPKGMNAVDVKVIR